MDQLRALLKRRLRQRGARARLAERSGISPTLIGRWADEKSNVRPSPRNLERLAPAIGVPYAELMEMAGYPPVSAPLPQRQASFDDELRRWLAVMGPRMGDQDAEDVFWDDLKQRARDRIELAEAAANSAPQVEDNAAANQPATSLAPDADDAPPGINRASFPELVGAGR